MELVKLITKKLDGTISKKEEIALNNWLEHSKNNRALFFKIKDLKNKGVNISEIENFNLETGWNAILQKYEAKKKKANSNFKFRSVHKYAAIFLGFSLISFSVYNYTFTNETTLLIPDSNAITLKLDSGEVKVLNTSSSHDITDAKGNVLGSKEGNKLDYKATANTEKLVYNTLSIPYGKTFEITLSDGTKVNLNAGSTIKYPIKFLKGKKRKVFLTGEAFFDVSEDKVHPFIVKTTKMNVTVLGTEFNVSAYPEDNIINTVLVEGSVSLGKSIKGNAQNKEIIRLEPNQKASWNKKSNKVKVRTVDTDIYTSWIGGRLVIKNMPFRNIIKKLERKYNVTIQNNYKEIGNYKFTASFDVETIEKVLSSFSENKAFKFERTDNTIIIDKL
ncbi:FecR domain-containing protein [Flavivirga amylovorans]|uniref:FecR domain-containing protein n=1 Tax=Flavivirga amylovorans TaxID=870486 RepID=A0ABT8WWU7_9FLAO|nr:FecR domain-containing protein [Flavivirga amylovorans]MDO5985825.1 FecR domain-containing protein [Flavivirga amylovorans]